jgi:murein DD-endopeptidase MepM/ murein hydrolase activator NlpD
MKTETVLVIVGASVVALLIAGWVLLQPQQATAPTESPLRSSFPPSPEASEGQGAGQVISPTPTAAASELVEPVPDFRNRITKKPFGIFITPATSPVQPERFSGYHTAIDIEYDDVEEDVPVKAIADGEVVASRRANGYGGVVVIRHTIDGASRLVLYGHLDPASMVKINTAVQAGDTIGQLGEGGTPETDGERKHLHLGVLAGDEIILSGYVQSESQLGGWIDPLSLTW